MNRILLLLENNKNRDLLAEWLATHYRVVLPELDSSLDKRFDLCIIDEPMLNRHWQRVQMRKKEEEPLFLPFVLVTSSRDVELASGHLWQTTDELIRTPVDKMELQARVEILLRTRQLSVELKMRNEDLESFIHAMIHDVKAPLRAIGGFADALFEDEADRLNEGGRHYLEMIRSATKEVTQLIEALLGFTRLDRQEIELQQISVQTVIESCQSSLAEEIQARHARVIVKGELPVVMANYTLLKVTLINLISNALKFMPAEVQPEVTISARCAENICRILVQDNGIGIEPEDQPRLFKPFVRLHGVEVYAGVGLGLATVRKAVEIMGGRVGVESQPGKGSNFWIELSSRGE